MSGFEELNLLTPDVVFTSVARSRLLEHLFPELTPRPKYFGWEKVFQRYSEIPRHRIVSQVSPEPYAYIDYQELYDTLDLHAQ